MDIVILEGGEESPVLSSEKSLTVVSQNTVASTAADVIFELQVNVLNIVKIQSHVQ